MHHADAVPAPARSAHRLAQALRRAIADLRLAELPDPWQQGRPLGRHPALDLAVAVFPPPGGGAGPVFDQAGSGARPTAPATGARPAPPGTGARPATPRTGARHTALVQFAPDCPQGRVLQPLGGSGPATGVQFWRDLRDTRGDSVAWLPGADWSPLPWHPLWPPAGTTAAAPLPPGAQAIRPAPGREPFVAPYPASLLKLMVAVGVAGAVDAGLCDWPDDLEPMITVSSNEATDRCVALLHRTGWLPHRLNHWLAWLGLPTLQLHGTTPAGGWRNADGAGVGQIHMTAWDTVRLLWLLDPEAPPPPWLPPSHPPMLSADSRQRLMAVLRRQQLDEILSSGRLRGEPGWLPGLPDAPAFAHKTGTTDNYASDAGIVRTGDAHYAVALLTTLGRRFAATPTCAGPWALPALGAAVHRAVMELGDGP